MLYVFEIDLVNHFLNNFGLKTLYSYVMQQLFASMVSSGIAAHIAGLGSYLKPSGTGLGIIDLKHSGLLLVPPLVAVV